MKNKLQEKITRLKNEIQGNICINCGRDLKEFEGRHGKFLGCPNWIKDRKCNTTKNVN